MRAHANGIEFVWVCDIVSAAIRQKKTGQNRRFFQLGQAVFLHHTGGTPRLAI